MEIPQTLQERLKSGKVIPFVGAGVSRSVKSKADPNKPLFPSWKELLFAAAEQLRAEGKGADGDHVRTSIEIDPPKYLEAAQHAREKLGPVWYTFLKEQLDKQIGEAEGGSLDLAKAVWNLGSNLVITTNYDNVLKWGCPNPLEMGSWDIQAPAEQARALSDGVTSPTLWYLHGQIGNAAQLILTPDNYSLLYPENGGSKQKYEAALRTLQTLFATRTVLFIGYSLDDFKVVAEMRKVHNIFDGAPGPHYVLAHQSEVQHIKTIVPEVEALPFSDYGEPLLTLVNALGATAAHEARTTDSTPRPNYDPRNRVFHVPYRRKGDQVIGRRQAMEQVRESLTTGRQTTIGHAAAFKGIGGLGKTQLAIEYAYEYQDQYPNGVIWLNADQDIGAQLALIADAAKWVAPESEHKVKYEVARHRLKSYSDCLIIFDNLEPEFAIDDYRPNPDATPHILGTSRIGHPRFSQVPLYSLTEEDSLALLLQEAGRAPDGCYELEAAQGVACDLGGLPLALELAGAYMRRRGAMRWADYRVLLRESVQKALDGRFLDSFTDHDRDLFATLTIDEAVFEEEPLLKDVLNILTWSARATMGRSLLCALLGDTKEIDLVPALSLGVDLRLLKKHPQIERYELHPLVLEVRRKQSPLDGLTDWVDAVVTRLGDWFESRRREFNALPQYDAEIDHLRTWQESALRIFPHHAARLAWLQAYPPYHRGRLAESQKHLDDAFRLLGDSDNNVSVLSANLFNDMGYVHGALGRCQKALEYQEKALDIRKALFGEKHLDTASSYNSIGGSYYRLGRYQEALEYEEKALGIRKAVGEHHPDTAESYNSVGCSYGALGKHQKALEFAEKALDICKALFGEQHPNTARSYNNVGTSYGALGSHQKALEHEEKALRIHLALFGEQHPGTAGLFNNVGITYHALGNHQKALEYAKKALEIRLALFGEQHPDTASSYVSVGSTYHALGNHQKALEYKGKALEIRLALFGEQHSDTASSYDSVSSTYHALGRHQKALEYAEKALGIRQALFGEQHPDTASSYDSVGSTYHALGRHQKALEYKEKALGIRQALFGEQHPDIARSYSSVGATYNALGRHQKALEYKEKALGIQQALFGEQHPDTADSYDSVGGAYNALGRHQKSLEYAEKALGIRQALFGEQHPDTADSYDSVGGAYNALGRHQKSLEYAEKALGIRQALFGELHPQTANSYSHVGFAHWNAGQRDLGLTSFEKAFNIRRQLLGDYHPLTVASVFNLAESYFSRARPDKAYPLLHEFLKTLPENHPDYLRLKKLRQHPPKPDKHGKGK